jgi:aconitate hydratase
MTDKNDPFGAKQTFDTGSGKAVVYRIDKVQGENLTPVEKLPYSIRVLLENALRNLDGFEVSKKDVLALAGWKPKAATREEIPYKPARVVLQDFTGVPAVVDLAALRSAMNRLGGDPAKINPHCPVDLVIDHSVQIDQAGTPESLDFNTKREFERNKERYEFLRWGKQAFENFRVIPPSTGIIHQVNLEFLASAVQLREVNGEQVAYPDTLVGTDSHTTMINGLGVLGWGVGGIEAEAAMLGQPIYMLIPEVVGFELTGELPEGATATDMVLTAVEMLRQQGVVGKFVEFYGSGAKKLGLADRATIANMAPEYGATMGFFPIDEVTVDYLRRTGRPEATCKLVENYCKANHLWWDEASPTPEFTATLSLDLSTVVPSIAGPKRPQDRIALKDAAPAFQKVAEGFGAKLGADAPKVSVTKVSGEEVELTHGSLVIASITSCTNTSNPSVMLGAGLLAKKAAAKGLTVPGHVKTSLAPGSRVVKRYLDEAGLIPDLEKLGFHIVGYGCATCIGNSGPLDANIHAAIEKNDLVVTSALSGNRNFEGRVHPLTRGNYLASPPLVVAFALAGRADIDFANEPLGTDREGNKVFLKDIWPTQAEVTEAMAKALKPEMFEAEYSGVFEANEVWNAIEVPEGNLYQWEEKSTYVREPPFFEGLTTEEPVAVTIQGARCMAKLGDSITTDHISPAGVIPEDSPTTSYLSSHGVERRDFNSYGSRRGNHEVMMRGTFGNVRLRNQLVPGSEGGVTTYLGKDGDVNEGKTMSIYDACMKYQEEGIPLVVLAGKEYGTGSSRDWAAKGTLLLGVKAVIAESYERIHRSNLIGMGVLPLQFAEGQSVESLGLTGFERFDIEAVDEAKGTCQILKVTATPVNGGEAKSFETIARIDSPVEFKYYRNGGILHAVLRDMAKKM